MTHDEVDRICDKLARAAKDARAKHKRNAELFGVGGSHQTQTWRLTTEAATLIRHLRDERDEARTILAGTDIGALPNDYPLPRMAQDRMDTLNERTLEGLALIGKVEHLKAQLEKAREEINYWACACKKGDCWDSYRNDNECPRRRAARVHAETK